MRTTLIHFLPRPKNENDQQAIETLLHMLQTEPLDPWFADENTLRGVQNTPNSPGFITFHGNFRNVSHAFSVSTDDPDLSSRLCAAFRKNPSWRPILK